MYEDFFGLSEKPFALTPNPRFVFQSEQYRTAEEALMAYRTIIESITDAPYQRVELTRDVHRHAEHILLTSRGTPLRAADALHLALARSGRAAAMATFDARLAAAARAAGLAVYPA